ncbi:MULTISPECIES: hypothetical protein [Photorhabdus]|nr:MULTISPECIES: hypothetical protein [Photorhabdus]
MTGVSECSQQRSNLKDNGYIHIENVFDDRLLNDLIKGLTW